MKIVDVNEFYADQGGGVKTYVNEKLRQAAALGHELVVIAPGPRDAEEAREGGRILWVKGPEMPFDPRYFVLYREAEVQRLIRREQPDVIEGSSLWSAGWFAARYPGAGAKALVYHQDPVAVYPQTIFDRWFSSDRIDEACFPYWQYVRRLASNYDATVVAGRWLQRRLETFGIPRAEAVPFGIDRSLFSPQHRDEATRKQLLASCGLGEGAKLLITVSRHHPEKRLGTLFKAVARVRRERDVGLVVFGDGPFRPWIQMQAARVPGVHLAGFVEDRKFVARVLASCDALLHGSAAETYGFVIAEAMCSGAPIVAPDRGGAFELVSPSFAESYRPGDEDACAAAVLRLLDRDRAQMSQAALSASHDKVQSPREHFQRLFDLYEELVERHALQDR